MNLRKRAIAESVGTFWLVFCGCGSAVLAAKFPELGIGFVGVALAFGFAVLTMAFAIGPISGAHLNPAVTIGMWSAGRFPKKEVGPYVLAQVVGGIIGAFVLYLIASGQPGFSTADGFAANGYGAHSPGGFSVVSGFISEVVMTFMFLIIILGATGGRASTAFAPLAIGLALTLIHLVSIPVTNTSVNPARSLAPALFVGGWAIQQLWLFIFAPLLGAIGAGIAYRLIAEKEDLPRTATQVMNPEPTLAPP